MHNFNTIKAQHNSSSDGILKLLSTGNSLIQEVELWLLNDKKNRNNWTYLNLEKHLSLFEDIPILIAYVNGKFGKESGHNFREVRKADGTTYASFTDEDAEHIVGRITDKKNVRIEVKDGTPWIVAKGQIWKWYAQELVAHLKEQGLEGQQISIETLIQEKTYDDQHDEVYTKWLPIGVTVLGCQEAVEGAYIKTLSSLGIEQIREKTLRVASMYQENNPQNTKNQKGVTKNTMKVKDLKNLFPGFTVLAVNGKNVALLSEKGVPFISTAEKNGEDIAVGVKTEIAVNAVFGEGENAVTVPVDAITEKMNAEIVSLQEQLTQEKKEKETAINSLEAMQKAEKARRQSAVKEAIKRHLAEVKADTGADIADNECDSLMTDEKIAEYIECVDKDGKFCGEERACKDVDEICMSKIREQGKQKQQAKMNRFAWDINKEEGEKKAGEDGIDLSIANILNTK